MSGPRIRSWGQLWDLSSQSLGSRVSTPLLAQLELQLGHQYHFQLQPLLQPLLQFHPDHRSDKNDKNCFTHLTIKVYKYFHPDQTKFLTTGRIKQN